MSASRTANWIAAAVSLAALLADPGALWRDRLALAAPVEVQDCRVPDVEPVPGMIVLAGVLRFPGTISRVPIATMSEQCRRNGAACMVDAMSAAEQQPRRRDALEVRDQPVHQRSSAAVRRVCDDRIDRTVMAHRQRVLAGADVAGIDASQAEGFQMPDQVTIAGTGSAKVRMPRRYGIIGGTAARGVG